MKAKAILICWLMSGWLPGSAASGLPEDHAPYLWPTDASQYLTSAFCEYRGRRFHAGIDIKTWGRVGYQVFAVRPGYVWRVSVSPFGYGKAVYLKLDTGEIAVYAHLSRFSQRIQRIVEAEQKRRGRYRVNLFLKPGQIPVAQGEVVAYTGQTGIGAPHLHFEIRSPKNKPLNPLSKGYRLPDRVKPIVTRVAFSPLDAHSEVAGDYRPHIIRPEWVQPGEYRLPEPITIWGNVGVAVASYDKDSNSANGFGVYALRLYVDDVLRFRYQYDELSFNHNKMVDLERDYRLARRNLGRFYKLYKDPHNGRANYHPNHPWAGVLRSARLETQPDLLTKADPSGNAGFQSGSLFPGPHQLRIEVTDYFGNQSVVTGDVHVGAAFAFEPRLSEETPGNLTVTHLLTYDLTKIVDLEAAYLLRDRWRPLEVERSGEALESAEKGGLGLSDEMTPEPGLFTFHKPASEPLILRLQARDRFGTRSHPYFYLEARPNAASPPPELSLQYDYYDDYLRLQIESRNLLPETPTLTLYPGRADSMTVDVHQVDLRTYVGRIPLSRLKGRYHLLRASTTTLNGEVFSVWENFVCQRVDPLTASRLPSEDGRFWVDFWPGSTYQPLYGRVRTDSLSARRRDHFASHIYHAEPQDVPLNTGARVVLRYAESEANPDKLGVYYRTPRRWVFIDNELDEAVRTVSAKVFSLESFALMRDEAPPEISRLRPAHQTRLRSRTPHISVHVHDQMSGIASENDIVLRLDGQKLIAEYDPERRRVLYQVVEPLAPGRHELSVWAQDRCKNHAFQTAVFWVE